MQASWRRFLFFETPIALIGLMILVQLIAWALSSVPLRRQRADELPLAVRADPINHQIILFGDSITRNVMRNYSVGSSDEVLNLATHLYVGLPGDVLLLKRYLETHKPPQYVVLAASPYLYTIAEDAGEYHYYLWNVYKRPAERAFLKKQYPDIDSKSWRPAILDLQQYVLEPAISLMKRGPVKYEPLGRLPDPNAPLEPQSDNAAPLAAYQALTRLPLHLAPQHARELGELCMLSKKMKFQIAIVWPPSPKPVMDYWRRTGRMDELEKELRTGLQGCDPRFFNLNDLTAYTVFDHGGVHLRGEGWEQRYARDLGRYLASLVGSVRQ